MLSLNFKNRIYNKESFWITRKWLSDKPVFTFWRMLFKGSYQLNNAKSYTRILMPTLWSFVRAVLYSTFIIILLELYNYTFPVDTIFDKQAVDTFLTAIASISGVFLGLYFTAISSIASNYLLRAPQNVKRYFLSEPKGQQYVQTIAITAIVSIFYIFAKSFGHTIHPAGLIFLALLVAYIIIRFWRVGTDVFYSLEPQHALPWISKNIYDSIKQVAPPGFQWNNSAIQNHHRRLVTGNFDLIRNLLKFGKEEMKIPDEQLIVALRYVGGLLSAYSELKRKIPTQSFWYEVKNEYQNWTLADSSQIAIALSTGITLQPKSVKDATWFEDQLMKIAMEVFSKFTPDTRVLSSAQGMDIFVEIMETYAKDFDAKAAGIVFKKLNDAIAPIYAIKTTDTTHHTFKEQLAFVDAQGRLAIATLLGLSIYLDDLSCGDIAHRIANIDWTSNANAIYSSGLPATVLPRLESMATELKNEKIIEGERISPEWYIQALCVQQYLFSLYKYFEFIKSLHDNHFRDRLVQLETAGQLPLAVQLIRRWKEFSNKYFHMLTLLKKHVEGCSQFQRVKDLPWQEFDFETEEKVALEREVEVKDKMIQLLPKLKELVVGKDLPDYFGEALAEGVEACYQACEDNDHERLKKILPAVFDASLAAYDKALEEVKDWAQVDSKVIFSTEPLENLLEISGYAKLYSELFQNPELWNVMQRAWDIYLNAIDAKKVIQFIGATSEYRDAQFTIMPQATLRTNWKVGFEHKMREHGFPMFPDRESYDYVNDRRGAVNHPSALIRVVVRHGGLIAMMSVRDIFFATYLSQRPEAEGVEFRDRHDIRESIQEEQRSTSEIEYDDE